MRDAVSAVPDFALAAAFLITWVSPLTLGDRMVSYLLLVMLLEFIIVHSAGAMGSVLVGAGGTMGKTASVLGLACFYTVFVGGFALAFKTWWPLGAFWLLILNRLLGVLLGQAPAGREKERVRAAWAAGGIFYVLLILLTTLSPVPRFGITAAVVSAQDLPGGGLWTDEPQRVIAFGFLYFTAVAFSELSGYAWAMKTPAARR